MNTLTRIYEAHVTHWLLTEEDEAMEEVEWREETAGGIPY